jgi:hypothetical protein
MTLSGDGTLTANFNLIVIIYTPSISVSPTTIQAGGTFTATGSGFNPALPIDLRVTDLYGNLLAIYSKSPAANGTVTFSNLVLPSSITYSGTGYVYGRQSDGSESNHAQVSISAAVTVQHRYYDRYVRIDSGTLPAYVRVYIQDLDANVYISQDLLTYATLGKKLCNKGSADVYDSHHIRLSVKNEGTGTIGVTFGLAYNAGASNGGNNPALTPGSETARVDIGTWSIFSASSFDFAGCEGTGPPPPGSDCDSKFPNRQTNLWEMIGWGTCVGVNAVWGAVQPVFQPIFDTISKMMSPFLQPWLDFSTALIGFVTATSDWIKDPWGELQKVADTTWKFLWSEFLAMGKAEAELWAIISKPITDELAKLKLELPDFGKILHDWLTGIVPESIKTAEAWAKNPAAEALKLAAPITDGFYDAATQVFRVVDPFAELFNPERFHTEQVQDVVRPIYDVLKQGEFNAFTLYAAVVFAPWMNLFSFLEDLIVGTEPATYEAAKTRSSLMIMISVEINALLTLLRAIGKFAPVIVSSLEGLADGLTQMVAAVLAIKSASEIFGSGWRASTTVPLERQWLSIALTTRPRPAEYMSMRAEGTITKADYIERMKEAGYSEKWSERLYDEYLREPSMRELATLYRRGKITREAFEAMYEVARLDRKYAHLDSETGEAGTGSLDAWHELVWNDPSWRQLNLMATSGKLTDDQIHELLVAFGTRPEYMDVLTEILKELPGQTQRRQVLTLEARLVALGRLDEAAYNTDAVELKVASQVAEMILRAERTRIQTGADVTEREAGIGSLNTWYRNDVIDAATYRQDASALSYSDTYIDRQLATLDKAKAPTEPPVTEREASRTMWDTWYLSDIITPDAWGAAYQSLGYDIEIATHQLAYLDKKKAPPPTDGDGDLTTERDLLQSEAIAAFKKHVIDETALRDRLDKLGRSDDAIEVLVAVAKMDMAVEQRDATLAVYAKAYRQGAILRSDYLAKLIDNQYTPDAAELIVQTEELSWGTGVETLTQTQILNSWELGFLDDEQVQKRLKASGLADTDMRVLLSNSVLDQLKAKHITNTDAGTKWTLFGVGSDVQANLLKWYGQTGAT